MRRCASSSGRQPEPGGVGLVADDGVLRQQRADDAAAVCAVSSPSGSSGRAALPAAVGCASGADEVGQRGQRAGHVVARLGEHVHLAAAGSGVLGLPG